MIIWLILLCFLMCVIVSSAVGFTYWLGAVVLCGLVFWILVAQSNKSTTIK